jgi:hypothetical protein
LLIEVLTVTKGLKISAVVLVGAMAVASSRSNAAAEPETTAINVTEKTAEKAAEKPTFSIEPPTDGPTLAYQLMRSFLTDEQWAEQVSALQQKFSAWEKENDGDIGRYLNDRFLIVAMGASSGEEEKMKRSVVFLAFYKEFNQIPPTAVANALKKHKGSLSELFTEFTWDKATQYIKNKEWRKDARSRKTEIVVSEKSGS